MADGHAPLLAYHQDRVNRSRRRLLGKVPRLDLSALLAAADAPARGVFKWRVEYGKTVAAQSFIPYEIKSVTSLQLVETTDLDYSHKYTDRAAIRRYFDARGAADDVLMTQHGYLTDASYANVALYDGKRWFTPAWPLLRGTRRQALLDRGVIQPSLIRARDLGAFRSVRLINAMMVWDESPTVDIARVAPPAS